MHLYLSNRSPLNSTYADESGQAMFKVVTPLRVTNRSSTISCVLPNDVPQTTSGDGNDIEPRFAHLAQVEHRVLTTSIIRFRGEEIKTKDMFREEGWGPYGRHRVFTGPDGVEYKWHLGTFVPTLVVHDEKQTPVATFHRKSLGIIGKRRPASLEIFPEGEHMVETILVTFIYVEKIRKDREQGAR